MEPLDIGTTAEKAINNEAAKGSYVFTYLDCARAFSTAIFGQRLGMGNDEFFCGPGISSGSVAERRLLATKSGKDDGGEETLHRRPT